MDNDGTSPSRRRLLRSIVLATPVSFAGCIGDGDGSTPTAAPDEPTPTPTDSTPTPSPTPSATPTPSNPTIEHFSVDTAQVPGEITFDLVASVENGTIASVTIETAIDHLERTPGQSQVTQSGTVEAEAGGYRTAEVVVETVSETVASSSVAAYVREFEPIEGQSTDIGAVYMPFFEHASQWDDCAVGEPAVGTYWMGDDTALARHGDLMRGFGINRLQFDFFEPAQAEPFRSTRQRTILREVPLEVMYVISNSMRWRGDRSRREQLDACLATIREAFLNAPNYAEHDGRPSVKCWNISWVAWAGNDAAAATRAFVLDEFGDYAGFVDHLRTELTVDGVEPYLIGGFGGLGHQYASGDEWIFDEHVPLAREFDAVSNWTGATPAGESVTQDDHLAYQTTSFGGYAELASNEPFEFIPVVNPGFDDGTNDCWGDDRHIPRGPEHLTDLLELAADHATVDRIDIASFNDWGEGHQLEPGTHGDTPYGTSYLEPVRSQVLDGG